MDNRAVKSPLDLLFCREGKPRGFYIIPNPLKLTYHIRVFRDRVINSHPKILEKSDIYIPLCRLKLGISSRCTLL